MKQSTKPFIAVAIASRGVGHIRAIASVIAEVEDYPHAWHWSFSNPIPDAQNIITESALADPRTSHIWFCEDDNLQPSGCLAAMLDEDKPIVAIDYRTRGAGELMALRHSQTGETVLAPMGNLLVKREVFASIPSPPFQVSTRKQWEGTEWRDTGIAEDAGGQDQFFCEEAIKAGYTINVLEGWEAGHLQQLRRGDHVNFGADQIKCWGGINLPWRPVERSAHVAAVYLKSPAGYVQDIDPALGGDPDFYLNLGWTQIDRKSFEAGMKVQSKRADEAREEYLTDLANGGTGPAGPVSEHG